MKLSSMLMIPALVMAMVGVAAAKDTDSKGVSGKVESVAADGTSVVIKQSKKDGGGDLTVTTDANTKVTIDKEKGKSVSDLKAGMMVKISPATGTATKITATKKKEHKPKKDEPTTPPAADPVTPPATQPATQP